MARSRRIPKGAPRRSKPPVPLAGSAPVAPLAMPKPKKKGGPMGAGALGSLMGGGGAPPMGPMAGGGIG